MRSLAPSNNALGKIRSRLYQVLEEGHVGDRTGYFVGRFLVFLIVINLASMTLESVPSIEARWGTLFEVIEIVSLIVFSVEYVLRLWAAAEYGPPNHLSTMQARARFALSFDGLIDLLAVLPFWIAVIFRVDLRFLLVLRAIRFLKLVRHSAAIRSLFEAISSERRALLGSFVIFAGTTLISAS